MVAQALEESLARGRRSHPAGERPVGNEAVFDRHVVAVLPTATGTSERPTTPGAACEIAGDEAALVAEVFRRYADDGASIADLARWLTSQGVATRIG